MKGIFLLSLLSLSLTLQAQTWTSFFFPGQYDVNGNYIGGTEVMALVPHKGKLFAATSYVDDLNNAKYNLIGGTPILALDSANGHWRQDVLFSNSVLVPSLKEIIFTKDYLGNSITPDTVLITGPNNKFGYLSVYTRNDTAGTWSQDSITALPSKIEIRSIGTHYDAITGHQYIFIGVSDYGIWRGEYNPSAPGRIQWQQDAEFTIPFDTRVPAIIDVDGSMYIGTTQTDSWTSQIFRRIDGLNPSYQQVFEGVGLVGSDMRGFTPVKNPQGLGYDLWFYWNDYFKRLEPLNHDSIVNEMQVSTDLSQESGRDFSSIITAAYNDHQLIWKDPSTNDTLMFIGMQAMYDSTWLLANPYPNIGGRTMDGMYYTRKQDSSGITYKLHYIVNNTPVVLDTLLAVRTICISPFASDSNRVLYSGGYHTDMIYINNTAWVYKGTFETIATGVNSVKAENSLAVFPNPARQSFTVNLPEGLSDLILYDVAGQKVYERTGLSSNVKINCKGIPDGIYFLHVTTSKQSICNQKIVVAN